MRVRVLQERLECKRDDSDSPNRLPRIPRQSSAAGHACVFFFSSFFFLRARGRASEVRRAGSYLIRATCAHRASRNSSLINRPKYHLIYQWAGGRDGQREEGGRTGDDGGGDIRTR